MAILWEEVEFDMHANLLDPGAMNMALSAFDFLSSTTGSMISHENCVVRKEEAYLRSHRVVSDCGTGVLNSGWIFYSLDDLPSPCSSGANIFHCHEGAWFLTS
jgi:hypothetical protein